MSACCALDSRKDLGHRGIVGLNGHLAVGEADPGRICRSQRLSDGRLWRLLDGRWNDLLRRSLLLYWRLCRMRKSHRWPLCRHASSLLLRRKLSRIRELRLRRWLLILLVLGLLRLVLRRNPPHPVVNGRSGLRGLADLRLPGVRGLRLRCSQTRTKKQSKCGCGESCGHAGLCYSKGRDSLQ